MEKPILPNYTMPENDYFHPPFEYAAREAIKRLNLEGKLDIKRQYKTPTGPVDFVLFDKNSKKVLAPIEIKRLPGSVKGQGRRQARDYWLNLGNECSTNFYCVSNLEITELFKNDANKKTTASQQIVLTPSNIGSLQNATNADKFYEDLIIVLKEIIKIILNLTPAHYVLGLPLLQNSLRFNKTNIEQWHGNLIPACFAYIRGAAKSNISLKNKTKKWKDPKIYEHNIKQLIHQGSSLNFEKIFTLSNLLAIDLKDAFSSDVLNEANESGRLLGNGDEISELVYEVLAIDGIGIVESDHELAALLSIVSRYALGRELRQDEMIIDPACGSGRLLSAAVENSYKGINPPQLWGNEIEERFSESLSLRLGLLFPAVISKEFTPKITIGGIEDIDQKNCNNIKVVLMNPPFISGVQSVDKKKPIIQKIKSITSKSPLLNIGQVAYEILFLELVTVLFKNETVISCIFPVQHIFRTSKEAVAFRRFLIEKFCLSHVVIYPGVGLFEKVVKQTMILIGTLGVKQENIKFLEFNHPLKNLNFEEITNDLFHENYDNISCLNIKEFKSGELYQSADEGWKDYISDSIASSTFLNFLEKFNTIGAIGGGNVVRRGTVGNQGNTPLTVIKKNEKNKGKVELIPSSWLRPLLNNTKNIPKYLCAENAPEITFLPPPDAYINGTDNNLKLVQLINGYLESKSVSNGKQAKKNKDLNSIIKNLKSDQKDLGTDWILIQRGAREKSQISILNDETVLISSNVMMLKIHDPIERILMASWLQSIFGQAQLEFFATPQEGMRKLEVGALKNVKYPDFNTIDPDIKTELLRDFEKLDCLYFKDIKETTTDGLWAKVLSPLNPNECRQIFYDLLIELVGTRINLE